MPLYESRGAHANKLGTFAGVFTPSLLTILGIILFLRLGHVLGASGFEVTLLIIVLANALSIITSLSLSAIATNLHVKAGGDYYLISRTLGLGFGGAIGLVLFFAQAISIGFYCMGFGEAVADIIGADQHWVAQAFAAGAIVCLFGLAWAGADLATKFQFVIMALLFAALAAFGWGAWHSWTHIVFNENLPRPDHAIPFWAAFAIFFPAVTGFTQGVSMSGDLKDPGRSIPRGTLAAVLLSFVIYIIVTFLLAGSLPSQTLAEDYSAMKLVAFPSFLIAAGVIAATLSSALASFLGAPRILQSLSKDKVFPLTGIFAKGHGSADNPRAAVILSGIIALITVSAGNLNLVASVVSMFFLLSYGLLNYATYYEARGASPFFRPTFRIYHHWLSLAGAVGCFFAMIMIDMASALMAAAILFAIVQYVRLRAVPARWADSRRSYYLQQIRENLLGASKAEAHARDWRPMLLVFTESSERREPILRFASWITGSAGVMMVCRVIIGDPSNLIGARDEAVTDLAQNMKSLRTDGFPFAVVASDLDSALSSVIQSAGIGPVQANTVVTNWADSPPWLRELREGTYSKNLRTAFGLGRNLVVLNAPREAWTSLAKVPAAKRRIDVWWSDDHSSQLALMLAYLMTRDTAWADAKIRVLSLASDESNAESKHAALEKMLEKVRIPATPAIVIGGDASELMDESRGSALTYVPFTLGAGRMRFTTGEDVEGILKSLPIAVMVAASEEIRLDVDPDKAHPADVAAR